MLLNAAESSPVRKKLVPRSSVVEENPSKGPEEDGGLVDADNRPLAVLSDNESLLNLLIRKYSMFRGGKQPLNKRNVCYTY